MVANLENLRQRFEKVNPKVAKRLRNIIRDYRDELPEELDVYHHPSFRYDFGSKVMVMRDGRTVRLIKKEIAVFERLLETPNQIVSSSDLWMSDDLSRVYISRLRKKIEPEAAKPEIIITAVKHGYYLADSSKQPSTSLDLPEASQTGDKPDFYHHRLFTYDYQRECVFLGGQTVPVHLTPREASLLEFLLDRPNVIFTKEFLLENIFGQHYSPDALKAYIYYLRHKIEPDPRSPQILRAKHGAKYRRSISTFRWMEV